MAMITVKKMAMAAMMPAAGPISSRAISASDLPSRRTDAEDDEVVHGAAHGDADEDPQEARQEAELRRQHRADERPGAGDGREVVAEEHPLLVATKSLPSARRWAGVTRASSSARTLAAMKAE